MVELVKVYGQDTPDMRFVGRKYGAADMAPGGGYGNVWGEWFSKGLFAPLEELCEGHRAGIEDDGAYVGLIRNKPGGPSEYWVGMFLKAGAPVPEGYQYVDFPAGRLGVAWLKGPEWEIYSAEKTAVRGLEEAGFRPAADADGAVCFAERYACPRFTAADENGCVTLDICVFAED